MLKKRKTLKEIAQEAGVSITAASLYLNGRAGQYRLSQELCSRLEAIFARENYTPNINARAMNAKNTGLIGCILREEIQYSFWAEIYSGLDATLSKNKLHLLPTLSRSNMKNEMAAFDFLRDKGVDAYVWVPMFTPGGKTNERKVREYMAEKPVISMTCHIPDMPGVCVDESHGAQLALQHLLDLGHRRMAVMGDSQIYARAKHFIAYGEGAGISVVSCKKAKDVLQAYKAGKITAVFCFSDNRAFEIYQLCAEQHISIPEDLSIIGYDNLPTTQYFFPPLTTIHQPKYELGESTGQLLLNILNGNACPRQIKLAPTLVLRKSTAAPKI